MSPSHKVFLFCVPAISECVLSQFCNWEDPRERKSAEGRWQAGAEDKNMAKHRSAAKPRPLRESPGAHLEGSSNFQHTDFHAHVKQSWLAKSADFRLKTYVREGGQGSN